MNFSFLILRATLTNWRRGLQDLELIVSALSSAVGRPLAVAESLGVEAAPTQLVTGEAESWGEEQWTKAGEVSLPEGGS